MGRRLSPLQEFLKRESSGGVILLFSAAFGLAIANSPLDHFYFNFLQSGFEVGSGLFAMKFTVLKVINYLLMTLFFFVVGLEIKRELTSGHLSSLRKALTPFIGALGGMAIPAVLYLLIAGGKFSHGWGVPVATDIALAIGLLTLMGNSVAPSLRSFLLGLAVIDDIGAIIIIALFYSSETQYQWFILSILTVLLVAVIKNREIRSFYIYILLGALLWFSLYKGGVHPTLAGVIMGLLTPNIDLTLSSDSREKTSLIVFLEEKLHSWSTVVVVPLFAFSNTGVPISFTYIKDALTSPIAWGIGIGLIFGKPIGIFISTFISQKLGIVEFPREASYSGLLATGSAAGIGFTVAIFIAHLAFIDTHEQNIAIIAVIFASILSGLLSIAIFKLSNRQPRRPSE